MNTPIDRVCGSCRYYAAETCHLEPPIPMLFNSPTGSHELWARPHVEPDDIACASFAIPYELEDRMRRHAERIRQTRQLPPNRSVSQSG